jgi:aminoglycoside phosphotransferase (APT) family kinase protein
MTVSPTDNNKFQRLAQTLVPGSHLLRTWILPGGVSAQVTALELRQPDGRTHRLVVRQHGAGDLQHNPQIAAAEFRLLHLLHAAGLPAPRPYYLDQSGTLFPTPYIVLEYVEGAPEFAPADLADYLRQFAAQLARIHALDGAHPDWSFLPRQAQLTSEHLRARPTRADEAFGVAGIRETLAAAWPLPRGNGAALLHGDFWPGNLLWQEGRLVAVLDWEDAQVGDPLADVANSRLEILWAFGSAAMQQFTQEYQSRRPIDFTNLPYWDLWAALGPAAKLAGWGLDAHTERMMREGLHEFIAQAFARLANQ